MTDGFRKWRAGRIRECLGVDPEAAFKAGAEEPLAMLAEVLEQACHEEGGKLDSMATSAYADGLRLLAAHRRFVVEHDIGRRVIGRMSADADSRAR